MKTLFKLFLLLFFGLSFQNLFAQTNFSPGYIVTIEGDTISGLLSIGDGPKFPEKLVFKKNDGAKRQNLSIADLKAFMYKNQFFERAIVEREISPIMTSKLEYDSKIRTQLDTVFVKLLVAGEKGLYMLIDETKKENYYIRQADDFTLLMYKRYLKERGGKDYILENKKFAGQLSLYFKDCPTVEKEILKEARYTQKYLTWLFENYLNCKNQDYVIAKKEKKKINFRLGIISGLYINKSVYSDLSKSVKVNPSIGAAFEIVFPKKLKYWSIQNEIIYSSIKGNNYIEGIIDGEDWYLTKEYRFGYSYINIWNTVRFNYTFKGFGGFLDLGMSNNIIVGEPEFYYKEFRKIYFNESIKERYIKVSKRRSIGWTAGAGLRLNRFAFQLRYNFVPLKISGIQPPKGALFFVVGFNIIK